MQAQSDIRGGFLGLGIRVWVAANPVGLVGVEEVLGADGAGGQVAAGVGLELGQVHAGVAVHAVAGVDAQALPPAAQVAEGAVVDRAPRLVVPQPADAAVVPPQACAAGTALRCRQQESVGALTGKGQLSAHL